LLHATGRTLLVSDAAATRQLALEAGVPFRERAELGHALRAARMRGEPARRALRGARLRGVRQPAQEVGGARDVPVLGRDEREREAVGRALLLAREGALAELRRARRHARALGAADRGQREAHEQAAAERAQRVAAGEVTELVADHEGELVLGGGLLEQGARDEELADRQCEGIRLLRFDHADPQRVSCSGNASPGWQRIELRRRQGLERRARKALLERDGQPGAAPSTASQTTASRPGDRGDAEHECRARRAVLGRTLFSSDSAGLGLADRQRGAEGNLDAAVPRSLRNSAACSTRAAFNHWSVRRLFPCAATTRGAVR
jgi:hypothetical protein